MMAFILKWLKTLFKGELQMNPVLFRSDHSTCFLVIHFLKMITYSSNYESQVKILVMPGLELVSSRSRQLGYTGVHLNNLF